MIQLNATLTLIFGEILQVYEHREVVARLRCHNIRAILALEDSLGAVLDKLREALDLEGNEDLGLAFGSRDMEGYAIEVGDDLVDVGGSSSVCGVSLADSGAGCGGVERTQRSGPLAGTL